MIERAEARGFGRGLLHAVIVSLLLGAPLAPVQASMPAASGIVGTDAAIAMSERADTVARVNALLMQQEVRAQLEDLGVSPADAMERVAALTDAELAQLEARLGELPAGGGVLGVLGVVLVVLLVLELLGVTNVFTGI